VFLYFVRHALRLLVREPAFTLATVLTLGLGVGANVAVFAVVEAVLLRPFPYPQPDRLVIINHRDSHTGVTKEYIAMGDFVDLAQRQQVFQSFSAYGNYHDTIFGVGEPFPVAALAAGPGLLDTLDVHPSLGRALTPADSRPGAKPVALLSHHLWQTRFGSDPHIVGRSVKVGETEVEVVGIAPPAFAFPPNARADVIVPATIPLQTPAERKSDWTFAVARLKPATSVQQATNNLRTISGQLELQYPRANQGSEYFAKSLRDALVGDTKPALILVLSAVSVVLLIACANVANLLLARSLARRREMALRVALGAARLRLAAQLLTESLALALSAGIVGTLSAVWGARGLVALVPKSTNLPGIEDVHINSWVLAFALGITIATALIFGVVSALTIRVSDTAGTLGSTTRVSMGASARRTASALVVAEIAFAIVLLIGAGLIQRSFSRLLAVDPGFRPDHVMTINMQAPADRYKDQTARRALFDRLFPALKALPDVREVGAAIVVPLTGNNWTVGFDRADRPVPAGQRPPEVGWQVASGGYFRALRIPLVAGRLFDNRDRGDTPPVVIVSEAIQRQYFAPGESAVGRQIKLGKSTAEIIGVVGNIKRAGLRDSPRSDLYFPFEQQTSPAITLFIRTAADPRPALPGMQAALRAVEPDVIVAETKTMDSILGDSVQVIQFIRWLLGIFAATSLALAAVGIYSIMSYVVRQRSREIGTRVALGATRGDIVWLVMRQGAQIAAAGTVIGIGGGLVAARSLTSILYGTSASDPVTLGLAAAVLGITTLAACYVPARWAAAVDPARTLSEQ